MSGRGPEPVAGRFTLMQRAPGAAVWRDAGTWEPELSATAYEAFFAAVMETGAGGELVLFDPRGARACSLQVHIVIPLTK